MAGTMTHRASLCSFLPFLLQSSHILCTHTCCKEPSSLWLQVLDPGTKKAARKDAREVAKECLKQLSGPFLAANPSYSDQVALLAVDALPATPLTRKLPAAALKCAAKLENPLLQGRGLEGQFVFVYFGRPFVLVSFWLASLWGCTSQWDSCGRASFNMWYVCRPASACVPSLYGRASELHHSACACCR